jgi:hypothetical protein
LGEHCRGRLLLQGGFDMHQVQVKLFCGNDGGWQKKKAARGGLLWFLIF